MLELNGMESMMKSGNVIENFNYSSDNQILENVGTQSSTGFLQLTSTDLMAQPIDIKFEAGYVEEVVGEYSLTQENREDIRIKKESLPLPDFQQVWMNENPYQFPIRNSTEPSGGVSVTELPYQYSSSYPAGFNGGSTSQQYIGENFLVNEIQVSPPRVGQGSSAEVLSGGSPTQLHQYMEHKTSPDSSQRTPQSDSPQYFQADQEYLPGTVTVMVLNEDGSLDKKFTVPKDMVNQALISTSPSSSPVPISLVSPPQSSPRIPLDLSFMSSSTISMPSLPKDLLSQAIMSSSSSSTTPTSLVSPPLSSPRIPLDLSAVSSMPTININNSTINMTAPSLDMSTKTNMYSFSNSNNNAQNLLANQQTINAVSGLTRPLPRAQVLGEQTLSSQVPDQILHRAMSSAFNFPVPSFENLQSYFVDQKENIGVPENLENMAAMKKVGARAVQRHQPYSVASRKAKSVGSKKSIGAIGQSVHGLKENKQVCPLCSFEAATKNPYRHLQDHLARTHFKERLARELPVSKPFDCPIGECSSKNLSDWQAVMRHYIGNKHGILEKYVREELASRVETEEGTGL